MEADIVRQLPDGEELVIVRDTSPMHPSPTATDPNASWLSRREAAVAARRSDHRVGPSWSPSSDTAVKA
jgi:hypothetical protein